MNPVLNRIEVVVGLLEGIFSGFGLSLDLDEKLMGVGLLDLAKDPVFHLEDDQANIIAVNQEIGFVPVDLWKIPAVVVRIGLGHALVELVEGFFPLCLKLPDIIWNHDGHKLFA